MANLTRDFPDDSQTDVFSAFLQDSREARTATSVSGSPNGVRGIDLAIFLWHLGALLPLIACERTIERLTLALVVAAAAVPRSSQNFLKHRPDLASRVCQGVGDVARLAGRHSPAGFDAMAGDLAFPILGMRRRRHRVYGPRH